MKTREQRYTEIANLSEFERLEEAYEAGAADEETIAVFKELERQEANDKKYREYIIIRRHEEDKFDYMLVTVLIACVGTCLLGVAAVGLYRVLL